MLYTRIKNKFSRLFDKEKTASLPVPPFRCSYAQHGEDLLIEHLMRVLKISKPFFIDVGAHHPYVLSNTYLLYLRGARGVNIEPDPTLIVPFSIYRPEDINLQCGMCFDEKTEADLFIMSAQVLNTFSETEANHVASFGTYHIEKKIKVPLLTLPEVVNKYCSNGAIDFISIDVEGLDFDVIKTNDIAGIKPKVLCIETVNYTENNTEKKELELIDYICSIGYRVYADTYLNTIFVENKTWNER